MENDLLRLDDMVALVTGCTSSIGQAIVERFSVAGATVIETDLDVESNRQNSRQHREQATDVVEFDCDLMRETDVSGLVEQSLRQFGRIDVLVNNAAFHNGKLLERHTWSDWLDFARFFVGQMVPHLSASVIHCDGGERLFSEWVARIPSPFAP